MPSIIPFKAIYPSPERAANIAVYIESMSLDEAKAERDRNPLSYIHVLVPDLSDVHTSEEELKDLAFKKIAQSFNCFIDKEYLLEDAEDQFYIIEIQSGDLVQKGIWALTSIDDYLESRIKKHELIRPEREHFIQNYLENAHLDSNPVLVTYSNDSIIDSLIQTHQEKAPFLSFKLDDYQHRLWKLDSREDITKLQNGFEAIHTSYIADGHHRAAAFASYGLNRRQANTQHKSNETYNFFSTVYMAEKELKITAYHRLIKDLNGLTTADFLQSVRRSFHINQISSSQVFSFAGCFTMYLDGMFFTLMPKDHVLNRKGLVANLEVSLLQDFILAPILNIEDPRTDSRISFKGGDIMTDQLLQKVDNGEFAVLFLMNPLSLETIIKVADAGEVMPPKSTFVRPKFPVGLLVHKIEG